VNEAAYRGGGAAVDVVGA